MISKHTYHAPDQNTTSVQNSNEYKYAGRQAGDCESVGVSVEVRPWKLFLIPFLVGFLSDYPILHI